MGSAGRRGILSGAQATDGRRPRTLVVGSLPGRRRGPGLEASLELRSASPQGAPESLRQWRPDVVLLDGGLPPSRLRPLLSALEESDGLERPAVIVAVPAGRRLRGDSPLWALADDVIFGLPQGAEMLTRVRGALRVREYVCEIARQNAEMADLRQELAVLSRHFAEDLRLAGNVQRSLMPSPLQHPRLDVAREFIPIREIGGDYYDFLSLGPHRLAFALGDVMGKGIPAALLAATLSAAVRSQLQAGVASPAELIARVNRLFCEVTPAGLFASLFFAVFDLSAAAVEYVNAGHHYPFCVRSDGSVEDLTEGGTVLGLVDDALYGAGRIEIREGDLFVFYSDGVTDRLDREGELYGVERLKDAALRSRTDPARISLYSILGDVQGWSGGTLAEDDATLIVAKIR